MSKLIQLRVVTPEKLVLEELVESVTLPTKNGEITILPDHIPLIVELASGDIVALVEGEHIPMAVVGGFIEVKNNESQQTEVVVLADFAEHIAHISDVVIGIAKARAEELRRQAENKEIVDFEHFETELERSLTRIRVADKWKNRKYRK